jgi:hypothetical protein
MDTQASVYVGADAAITNSVAIVPPFPGTATNTIAAFAARPTAAAIITASGSITTNAGATVSLSVSATGTTPLSYQWMKNGAVLNDTSKVSGTASPTLTLTGVGANDSAGYRVVVTNDVGGTTSDVATVIVVLPPQFTSASVSSGGSPLFSLALISNVVYRVEVSSNLKYWDTLTNVIGTDGVATIKDPQATNFTQRYYRAVWVP